MSWRGNGLENLGVEHTWHPFLPKPDLPGNLGPWCLSTSSCFPDLLSFWTRERAQRQEIHRVPDLISDRTLSTEHWCKPIVPQISPNSLAPLAPTTTIFKTIIVLLVFDKVGRRKLDLREVLSPFFTTTCTQGKPAWNRTGRVYREHYTFWKFTSCQPHEEAVKLGLNLTCSACGRWSLIPKFSGFYRLRLEQETAFAGKEGQF